MKQVYAIIIVSFMCLGLQAQAGSSPMQESPAPAIDPIVAEVPAEVFADVANETKLAPEPVVDEYVAGDDLKTNDVSIVTITMDPELNINVFESYTAGVELTVSESATVHTVTLSTTPVSLTSTNTFVQDFKWNHYTHGAESNNDPVVKIETGDHTNFNFFPIRPDDIYPEIHFVSSGITHSNEPENILIN